MVKHLKRLVDQNKGKKLADEKQLTGKGRLTNKLINSFQVFYGMAIRKNKSEALAMQKNVMAILYHYSSTKEEPQHHFCPEGESSWCKWQVDKVSGTRNYLPLKNPLSPVLVEMIKPVFDKLSSLQLLKGAEKCLTQNQNESLHHVIWSYLPKGEYHSPTETLLGVALAVGHFNDGMVNFNTQLFHEINLKVGINNKSIWAAIDNTRLRHAAYKHSDNVKEKRKDLKAMEAAKLDSLQYDDSYSKEQYYSKDVPVNNSKNKTQRKCKKCGNPMKGHKRGSCEQATVD